MGKLINISGRLHSREAGETPSVVTGANEVYDDDKHLRQSEINANVDEAVTNLQTAVGTKQQMITKVNVDVENRGGEPYATASVEGDEMNFHFRGVKGEKGETGNGISDITEKVSSDDGGDNIITIQMTDGSKKTVVIQNGRSGKPGATSVYDPTTQDFLTTLETEPGQSETKTMTQKAISDAIADAKISRYETVAYQYKDNISLDGATQIGDDGTYASRAAANKYKLVYIKVDAGDIIFVKYNNLAGPVSAYIGSEEPSVGVAATLLFYKGYNSSNPETPLQTTIVMPREGYFAIVTKTESNAYMPELYKGLAVKDIVSDNDDKYLLTESIDIDDLNAVAYNLNQYNNWVASQTSRGVLVPIAQGNEYVVTSNLSASVGILKNNTVTGGAASLSNYYPSRLIVAKASKFSFVAPTDARYIFLQTVLSSGDNTGIAIKKVRSIQDVNNAVKATDERIEDNSDKISRIVSGFNRLIGVESSEFADHQVLNTDGSSVQSVGSIFYIDKFLIQGAKLLYVSGRAANGASFPDSCLCCFFDANDHVLRYYGANRGATESITYTDLLLAVPEGAAYILVSSSLDHAVAVKAVVDDLTTIHPLLERGSLHPTGGGLVEQQDAAGGISTEVFINIRTAKFIDIRHNSALIVKSGIPCYARAVYYDSSYNRIGDSGSAYYELSSTPQTIELPIAELPDLHYVKFYFRLGTLAQGIRTPMFDFQITGLFDADCEKYNVRSADDGYQTVAVEIPVINGGTCNEETNTVQDVPSFGIDYGLLALPESYTNEGKPTRLIIYCHGAGTNYSKDIARFPNDVLLPEYFLSEGYAILDMDGECYPNYEYQHTYIPESLQCYLAAYKWVVKNYNICKDGIFLAGRSMGGGMCFSILNCGQIPVIAACPVVPVANTLWWWSYMVSNYRERFATRAGFVGSQPKWGSQQPLTTAEQNYLKANFDALRRWSPLWRCIVDLPTDPDVLFDPSMMVDRHETNVPEEVALYGSLHAKAKCPIKMFANYSDQSVPYERNAMLMHKMLLNGGQEVELRMFDVDNDQDTSRTAHYFEMRDDRLVPWTNSKGVEMSVSIVYIEMLAFWRRYE